MFATLAESVVSRSLFESSHTLRHDVYDCPVSGSAGMELLPVHCANSV